MTADSAATIPAPFRTALQTVQPEWIDYNGHMNVAYYTVGFDSAVDEVYEALGIGPTAAREDRVGPMALQSQVHFTAELLEGQRFDCDVMILDSDAKRVHIFATMWPEGADRAADRPAATYESLSLNVDLEARRAAPYRPEIAARIAAVTAAHGSLPRPPQVGAVIGIRRKG
jgi:acyl-CoA thioester hydrolase